MVKIYWAFLSKWSIKSSVTSDKHLSVTHCSDNNIHVHPQDTIHFLDTQSLMDGLIAPSFSIYTLYTPWALHLSMHEASGMVAVSLSLQSLSQSSVLPGESGQVCYTSNLNTDVVGAAALWADNHQAGPQYRVSILYLDTCSNNNAILLEPFSFPSCKITHANCERNLLFQHHNMQDLLLHLLSISLYLIIHLANSSLDPIRHLPLCPHCGWWQNQQLDWIHKKKYCCHITSVVAVFCLTLFGWAPSFLKTSL